MLQELLNTGKVWRASGTDIPWSSEYPSGFTKLDERLQSNGWPNGGVIEILHEQHGIGELNLLMPLVARLSQDEHYCAWIAPLIAFRLWHSYSITSVCPINSSLSLTQTEICSGLWKNAFAAMPSSLSWHGRAHCVENRCAVFNCLPVSIKSAASFFWYKGVKTLHAHFACISIHSITKHYRLRSSDKNPE